MTSLRYSFSNQSTLAHIQKKYLIEIITLEMVPEDLLTYTPGQLKQITYGQSLVALRRNNHE
jgi:hypothetical protein